MRKKRVFWKTVLLLSLTGIVIILGLLAGYLYQEYTEEQQYSDLQETIVGKEEELTQDDPEVIFPNEENPVDFSELSAINPELYAWIRIPGTKIDYPIACHPGDDSYYLNHDLYGQTAVGGCIYTEEANSRDFTDPNTVIYGHNMENGTMFQNLHLFEESTFFEEHPYVYIYTPEKVLVYEIFAAYSYDDRHLLNSFDFSDRQVWEKYLKDIENVRAMDKNFRKDVDVKPDDRIITLETCTDSQSKVRYLVQAVLIQEG